MILEKSITLKLEVKGHKKMDDGGTIAFLLESTGTPITYIDIRRCVQLDSFYIEFSNVKDKKCHISLSTVDTVYIDFYKSSILKTMFKSERELANQLLPNIYEYLKHNKVPHQYMSEDNPDISHAIMEILQSGDVAGSRQFDDYGTDVLFEYDDETRVLKLINKYLTRSFELESIGYDDINDACEKFSIEWNSIIDGKYEFEDDEERSVNLDTYNEFGSMHMLNEAEGRKAVVMDKFKS